MMILGTGIILRALTCSRICCILALNPEPWYFTSGQGVGLNSQPLPSKMQAHHRTVLTLLADAVAFENMPEVLRNIGYSLMNTSSENKNASSIPAFLEDGNGK
jgi:hypothetical protein